MVLDKQKKERSVLGLNVSSRVVQIIVSFDRVVVYHFQFEIRLHISEEQFGYKIWCKICKNR